jgi:hypothetical protein
MTTVTISANAIITESGNVTINEETIKVLSSEKFKKSITIKYGKTPEIKFDYVELVNGYLSNNMLISFISKRWVFFISIGSRLFYFYNKKTDKTENSDKINVIQFTDIEGIYCNNSLVKDTDRHYEPLYALFGSSSSSTELLAILNTIVSSPTI